jgi:lysyl-tRNA synthetase class 2
MKDPASKYAELGISEDWFRLFRKPAQNLVDDLKEVNPQKLHQDICG